MEPNKKSPIELWQESKKTLDACLKSNEIEQAFYTIEEYLEKEHPDDYEKKDALTLFESQYTNAKQRWLHTHITYGEYEIVFNKVKQGLLEIFKSIRASLDAKNASNEEETSVLSQKLEDLEKVEDASSETVISIIDYDWNFEGNITLYFQFEHTNDETYIFNSLIKDAAWEQFIRRNWFLVTEDEPLGVRIPETIEPNEESFRDEPGFVKIEERALVWLDAVRFEIRDDERSVIAESIVIKKEKESQIWVHAIGETEAKSQFVSGLMRWFDEKLQGKTNFAICLNVLNGRGVMVQPSTLTNNEVEILIKQPFGIR